MTPPTREIERVGRLIEGCLAEAGHSLVATEIRRRVGGPALAVNVALDRLLGESVERRVVGSVIRYGLRADPTTGREASPDPGPPPAATANTRATPAPAAPAQAPPEAPQGTVGTPVRGEGIERILALMSDGRARTSHEIVAELDLPTIYTQQTLAHLYQCGRLARVTRGTYQLLASAPDPTTAQATESDIDPATDAEPPPAPVAAPSPAPDAAAGSMETPTPPDDRRPAAPEPVPAGWEAHEEVSDVLVALWSDGRLQIGAGPRSLLLSRRATERLHYYLQAIPDTVDVVLPTEDRAHV